MVLFSVCPGRSSRAIAQPAAPEKLVSLSGDRSVVLHWEQKPESDFAVYHVYRSTTPATLTKIASIPRARKGYADLNVDNGTAYQYVVRSVDDSGRESTNSLPVAVAPHAFVSDDEFLEYVERTAFDYFWYEVNPRNGLVRDRTRASSPSSIAAVGFGLTALAIGIEHGWISREEGAARTLKTLRTFLERRQGPQPTGTIGYKGWFYHFLDMETGFRFAGCELSSIDTGLLLAGMLFSRQYFNGPSAVEQSIRSAANKIFEQVDWQWMANGADSLTHGWHSESGFIKSRWIGYNESSILYILGLGTAHNPLPSEHWTRWTSGYQWRTNYGYAFVQFPPLFGHQYSHCWIDFRDRLDSYMKGKGLTYFENSRRATLAQRAYAIENPGHFPGYGSNLWGFTACDGPGGSKRYFTYMARGAPPPENDDGTIAPTAPAGSLPFTPEQSVAALREMYNRFRTQIWTEYGFRDAFNLEAKWFDPELIGIDQGPIVIMIENYRSGLVWKRFMEIPEIQRGLERAGFERSQR